MNKLLTTAVLINTMTFAHHGVAILGVSGPEGPGAPLETTGSMTLPEGKTFAYIKVDAASFEKYTQARDDEGDSLNFRTYGFGYGFTSYLSAYIFLPYYTKTLENSRATSGFHDIRITGVLGFKYDEGFMLTPDSESLDDLGDWHFSAFVNMSLPTGDTDIKDADGSLYDAGMQLGFGQPSLMIGLSASKWLTEDWTFLTDLSYNTFLENEYSDGSKVLFGDEARINASLTYKLYGNTEGFRLELGVEANYMHLGRDVADGVPELATGGYILYNTTGLRFYYNTISAGLGVKTPIYTDLNEGSLQQGSEGKENYRIIFAFSTLF